MATELEQNQVTEQSGKSLSHHALEAYREVYDDTMYFIDGLTGEYDFYPAILSMLQNGNLSLELKKRYTMKAIEEMWVSTIEDSLVALDEIIRNPSRFIEENEKVLPIEMSRHINARSIAHLSQHTDYINKVEGDMVTPSKILNVFYEETMMTYENKFINTLINRLYLFVAKRYDAIKQSGKSEQSTLLSFGGDFRHGEVKGRMKFEIEISQEPDEEAMRQNPACSNSLRARVERLYAIVTNYTASEFAKTMGKNYVRPPIMRTNAILKNKNLNQCLALWQFIESYDAAGYAVSVNEQAERADETYIKELYSTCALQYLIFRYKIRNDFSEDALNAFATDEPFLPKFVTDIQPFDGKDYDLLDSQYRRVVPYKAGSKKRMSQSERAIAHAIDVALAADAIYDEGRFARAEEAARQAQEAARLAEEQRLAELARQAEEARLAELARLEEERLAREAQAQADAKRREEERSAQLQRREEERQRERQARANRKKVGRKRKKKIRTAAERKAQGEGVALPQVFDYETYTRYLDRETETQDHQ